MNRPDFSLMQVDIAAAEETAVTQSPVVSVVMPVYNGERYLRESIESALAQTYPNLEVIVVDDGSTDRTHEILADFTGRIQVVRNEVCCGNAAARNSGIAAAGGTWVAVLDADDLWEPEKIEEQVRIADNADVVYTNVQNFGECDHIGRYSFDGRTLPQGDVFAELVRINFITHSSVLIRRSTLLNVGGYNVEFRSCSDWDLFLRIARNGGQFCGTEQPLTHYRWHRQSISKNYHRSHEDRLRVVTDALCSQRGLALSPRQRRQALAEVWFVSATFAAVRNNRLAIQWFARSATIDPFRLQTWKEILRCCVHSTGLSRQRIRDAISAWKHRTPQTGVTT